MSFPLNRTARIAVFASGRGSNLDAILNAYPHDNALANVVLIVSNNPDAGALEKARAHNIDTFVHPFPGRKKDPGGEKRQAFEQQVQQQLELFGVDLVCLAGFMRIFSAAFNARWQGRMLNIHPSLLPLFKGLHPQRQALAAGVSESGCTVHFVDAGVDTGPVVLQRSVPVFAEDDEAALSARILLKEHEAYPEAIRLVLEGQVRYPSLFENAGEQ